MKRAQNTGHEESCTDCDGTSSPFLSRLWNSGLWRQVVALGIASGDEERVNSIDTSGIIERRVLYASVPKFCQALLSFQAQFIQPAKLDGFGGQTVAQAGLSPAIWRS